jgi:hypothetical protein
MITNATTDAESLAFHLKEPPRKFKDRFDIKAKIFLRFFCCCSLMICGDDNLHNLSFFEYQSITCRELTSHNRTIFARKIK